MAAISVLDISSISLQVEEPGQQEEHPGLGTGLLYLGELAGQYTR